MNRTRIGQFTTWVAALAIALVSSSTLRAQVFTGRVDVTIEDATGGRLPGVSVDLTGPVTQTQVTDPQGQAHFLNLPVGTYAVTATLTGFNTYANNRVEVASGASTPLAAKLAIAGTAETVNVTAATPMIDLKRDTTTTNVSLEELQNIPSSRDPWSVMQTVPTVYMDRVNVGGAESGQQSNYNAKGAQETDNTWSIDGVPVTDMGATGSSAFYYDFDSFQEMAVTTGGADAQNPTGGVQLNMVLRKGLNTPHGDARVYFENQKLQGVNISPTLAAALGNTSGKGNRTDKYQDYGFDLGGPVLKDRLWIWGTIAKTDINLLTLTGDSDATLFKNYAAISRSTRTTRSRTAGASVRCVHRKPHGTRPARPSTTRAKATSCLARACSPPRRSPTLTVASSSRRKVVSPPITSSMMAASPTIRSISIRATVRSSTSAATPTTSAASTS
jgi:hypothetical protein